MVVCRLVASVLQLVLRMHAAMFELVDALAALQQAVAMPVTKVNGSWDWTLMHTAGALGALLLQAMQLAEATSAHVLGATADTTQTLLAQVRGARLVSECNKGVAPVMQSCD